MIACREVSAGYAGREVLHNVNFSAHAHEFVGILGPNGSGKTTLLRVLSGVLPKTTGQVELCGHTLERLSAKQRAQYVAVVPQRVGIVPRMLVRDMVLLGRYPYLLWFGTYSAADYAAAHAALEAAQATELATRFLQELSGGEVQRVLLARALAQQTPILLLDELASGLDFARIAELFDVLEIHRQQGSCVLTVMHDVNVAALYATRLLGVKNGHILFDGPVDQVFTEKNLHALYEIPLHVFTHPTLPVPQACLGRRSVADSPAVVASAGSSACAG